MHHSVALLRRVAVRILLPLAACSLALAADEALPKAETILDKFVEATGGKANHMKIKSEVTEGTLELPAQGLKGKLTIYRLMPNKSLTEVDFEGIGKMEQATDGTNAWDRSAIQGARVKQGEERDAALRAADMLAVVEWRRVYPKVETIGTDTVDGEPCYNVRLTPATGKPETRCFSKKSSLLLKSSLIVKSQMGEIPAESTFSDYKEVGGVLVPHKMTQKAMGAEIIMTITKASVNTEIPLEKFAMPLDVKALVEKAKAPPAPAVAPSKD